MKIIARAPSRISLIGGGTDVEPYASKYGGRVLSMAITLRSQVELFTDDDMYEQFENRLPYKADPSLFYAIFDKYGIDGMHHRKFVSTFDAYVGCGLGSSASASVALIAAINKLKGIKESPSDIANSAWDIEVNKLGWYGGKQDQYISAYGGIQMIEFGKDVTLRPLSRKRTEGLLDWLVLVYIGGTRKSRDIQNEFKKLDKKQLTALHDIKKRIIAATVFIESGFYLGFGELLDELWELKKSSNKGVSNHHIDTLYAYAKKHKALGGKVLGAGGAGYMVFAVKPQDRQDFIKKMRVMGIEDIDFSIDWNGVEARIV